MQAVIFVLTIGRPAVVFPVDTSRYNYFQFVSGGSTRLLQGEGARVVPRSLDTADAGELHRRGGSSGEGLRR